MSATESGPCVVVGTGGVGESGATHFLHYRVASEPTKLLVLKTTASSLCGNTGVIAVLAVNGEPKAHGTITAVGSSIQAEASAGDDVVVLVHTIPLFNGIVCVRLGELEFELEECELVE